MMKPVIFTLIFLLVFASDSEARRRRRSTTPVIINQILKLDGAITKNDKPAPEFSGVAHGDELETGDRSYAVIRIAGLGLFRMGPKTKIKLVQFLNRDNARIELINGEIKVLWKRLGEHQIKTDHAVYIPQVSTFILTSDKSDEHDDYVHCNGRVKIKTLAVLAQELASLLQSKKTKSMPSPIVTSTPTAALLLELTVSGDSPTKELKILKEEIKTQFDEKLKACDGKLIDELESLYDLP